MFLPNWAACSRVHAAVLGTALLFVGATPTADAADAASTSMAARAAMAAATEQTRALIRAYRSCCASPQPTQPNQAVSCRTIDPFFDYRLLATEAAASLRPSLAASQRSRLLAALQGIFAQTARQSGKAFCCVEPTIGGGTHKGADTQVEVEVLEPGEDVPTQFAFVWRQQKGRWRVADLVVEGGSLITDYQNQFARILKKEGASALLQRLEARASGAAQ